MELDMRLSFFKFAPVVSESELNHLVKNVSRYYKTPCKGNFIQIVFKTADYYAIRIRQFLRTAHSDFEW